MICMLALSVIVLSVIMVNGIRVSVNRLNVIRQNVVAPKRHLFSSCSPLSNVINIFVE